MTSAVIVSTARTPLAKSWKGSFNMTHGATLGGHAVKHAIQRAGIDAAEVDDVIMGCANPEGATGMNIARQIALMADCPITTSGMTVNRFCSSGLQTIALAAQRIIAGEADVFVAGGVESISCVQQEMNLHMIQDPNLVAKKPEIYWSMLQTAEQVAKRYNIGRDAMDEYGAASQQKACAAQAAGKFDDEIAPITVTAGVADPVMGLRTKEVTVSKDEGTREGTTKEGIAGIRSALPGGVISAGNASQFSDGAGACVLVSEEYASKKGLMPLMPSLVVPSRVPSSLEQTTSLVRRPITGSATPAITVMGAISSSNLPAACAATAFCWLPAPYSSIASRLML